MTVSILFLIFQCGFHNFVENKTNLVEKFEKRGFEEPVDPAFPSLHQPRGRLREKNKENIPYIDHTYP